MKRSSITHYLILALLGACGGNSDSKVSAPGQEDAGTGMQGTDDAGPDMPTPGTDDAGPGMPMPGVDDATLEADAMAKLKECQLEPLASEVKVIDDNGRCVAQCVLDASCADIKELFCLDTPSASNAAAMCLGNCTEAPADGFACQDGAKIPHSFLCDGEDDCGDGGDEVGCGEFMCADGEVVMPKDVTCDGFADCTDGSDEKDCPNLCG